MWYKGEAYDGITFLIKDQKDGSWITSRPTHDIFLQDGRIIKVKWASTDDIFDCLSITLIEPHNKPPGQDVWFTLPEIAMQQVSAAPSPPSAPGAAPSYPKMPGSNPAPFKATAMIPRKGPAAKPAMEQMEIGRADTDDMHLLDDFRPKDKKKGDEWDDTFRRQNSSHLYPDEEKRCGCTEEVRDKLKLYAIFAVLFVLVFNGSIIANIEICYAIGYSASKWLLVLLWCLLGAIVWIAIQGVLTMKVTQILDDVSSYDDVEGVLGAGFVMSLIVTAVCVLGFGIPIAWSGAQIAVAENYLEPSKTRFLSCFRDPGMDINQDNSHFVYVQEQSWRVDYAARTDQKVRVLRGQKDDGTYDGQVWNFCVAPIVYTGPTKCRPNMWAVCYRKTEWAQLSSCDESDAITCGFNWPVNGVTLRVLSGKEQFWGISDEDKQWWDDALKLATQEPGGQAPVLVGYGWEGPDKMQEYLDTAKKRQLNLRKGCYLVGFVWASVAAWILFFDGAVNKAKKVFETILKVVLIIAFFIVIFLFG